MGFVCRSISDSSYGASAILRAIRARCAKGHLDQSSEKSSACDDKAGRLLHGSRVEDDPGHGHDGDLNLILKSEIWRNERTIHCRPCVYECYRYMHYRLYQYHSAYLRTSGTSAISARWPTCRLRGFDRCFMMGPDRSCRPVRRSVGHHTASFISILNKRFVNRTGYLAGCILSSIARVSRCERQAGQA